MATGALDGNGIWQYGEDDSETTFSALLNKVASSVSTQIGNRRVLQVVNQQSGTQITSTTSTFVSVISKSITPKSTTSKILVIVNMPVNTTGVGSNNFANGKVQKNGSDLFLMFAQTGTLVSNDNRGNMTGIYFDSPATTSSVTYTFLGNSEYATSVKFMPNSTIGSITLVEVA